jgi:ankyrin repeat protein
MNFPKPVGTVKSPSTCTSPLADDHHNQRYRTQYVSSLREVSGEVISPHHSDSHLFAQMCSFARHGKVSDLETLLSSYPDSRTVSIDHIDDNGNTLLHIAAQNGQKRIVKLCLRYGFSVNAQNHHGNTPLHFASGFGYKEVTCYS